MINITRKVSNRKEKCDMLKKIKSFIQNEKGQGMVEYAILAAILVVVLIVAIGFLSDAIEGTFNNVTDELEASQPGN